MKTRPITWIVLVTALILSVPLVAMQFTDEVQWGFADFAIIGSLLIGTGAAYELLAARINATYRPLVVIALLIALLLAWAELAVGIFGTPFAGS